MSPPVIRTPARSVEPRSSETFAAESRVEKRLEVKPSAAKSVPSSQVDESEDDECDSTHSYEPS